MTFRESLSKRLGIIKPSLQQVCVRTYVCVCIDNLGKSDSVCQC